MAESSGTESRECLLHDQKIWQCYLCFHDFVYVTKCACAIAASQLTVVVYDGEESVTNIE